MVGPMKLKTFVVLVALVMALFLFAQRPVAPAQPAVAAAVLDLTHALTDHTPQYEFEAATSLKTEQVAKYEKHGYAARTITLPEQLGTHIDAPAHIYKGQWTTDQIPGERLVRPLVVLDVSKKARVNPDYRVSVENIAEYEREHGYIPQGAVVIARTGWDERWNDARAYRNADPDGALHFPGFDPITAKFLVEGRGAVGIGIDTLSVDGGVSRDFPVHKYMQSKSAYILENVANLWRAPKTGAMLVVAPTKIEGSAGAPVRLLALLK